MAENWKRYSPSQEDTIQLPAELEQLEDIDDAEELAEEWGVSLSLCKTTEEIKDRLRYHWMKQSGLMKGLEEAEALMCRLHKEDIEQRAELRLYYKGLEGILDKVMKDNRLRRQLETEGVIHDYKSTITKFIDTLNRQDCPIVVAGETSSGKSSLLNLFIGEDVLPAKLLSCTSTLCLLNYGDQRDGRLILKDGKTVDFAFEERAQYIYKTEDRKKKFNHEGVELVLPLPFLKSGVTLVDTPGIGENNSMASILLDYVRDNDVYGFIYVIKSDNAGGVASDRLGFLLRHLLNLKDARGERKFDPRTAIFVCNRWDMVPLAEQEKVRRDTIRKLSDCWPGFNPDKQLFFMNTELSYHTWKLGYLTDDYIKLIDGIKTLFPMGLQRKLRLAYWWVEMVLLRILHPVQTFINRTPQTSSEIHEKKKVVEERLELIRSDCDKFVDKFKSEFTRTLEDVSSKLHDFINSPEATHAICIWNRDDIPPEEFGDSWPIVEERLDKVVEERITEVLVDWEHKTSLTRGAQEKLFEFIESYTQLLSEDLEDVEKTIRGSLSNVKLSQHVRLSLRARTEADESRVGEGPDKDKLFRDFKVLMSEKLSIVPHQQRSSLQLVMEAIFLGPHLVWDAKRRFKDLAKSSQDPMKYYLENRVTVITRKAESMFQQLQRPETMRDLIYGQLEPLEKYTTDVAQKIPKLTKANMALLETILKDSKHKSDVTATYKPFEDSLVPLLENLIKFSYKVAKDFDISEEDIIKQQRGTLSRKPDRYAEMTGGMFASFSLGQFKRIRRRDPVTIKTYTSHRMELEKFVEEKNLRMLQRKDDGIPQLVGVVPIDWKPALVFKGHLKSARVHHQRANVQSKTGLLITRGIQGEFLHDLTKALLFLHTKKLVHVEVSLDTVMVNDQGFPRLTNLGEARCVELGRNVQECIESGVYLPPEALKGERYTTSGDVYSFAILVWELWQGNLAFQGFRGGSLKKFLALLDHPFSILNKPQKKEEPDTRPPQLLCQFLEICMNPRPNKRLNIKDLQDRWRDISPLWGTSV